LPGPHANAALQHRRRQLQCSCKSQLNLQYGPRAATQHRLSWSRCRSFLPLSLDICCSNVFAAVSGSFVHAHAVIVDSVRFAAFVAVSLVTPGSTIDNSQSGTMQLRECQCKSSLRYGCVMVGAAVIDCRFISPL
jgi:hypothetical protein